MRKAAILACMLGVALASPAYAQTNDDPDAERAFREGQRLMEEHRYGDACPKLQIAYNHDRALGTLLNLAFCHKETGATWIAWLEFREAEIKAIEAKRSDRRDFAHARLVELERSLRKVQLDIPKTLTLKDVLIDERRVPEAETGAVFALEEGSRKLSLRATGKRPLTTLIEVKPSPKVQHIQVPEMSNLTAEDLPPPPPPPPKEKPAIAPPPPPPVDTTQKTLGFVGIGVGSGAAALGLVMGAITLFGPCSHSDCTDNQRSSASTTGAVSTVSFIAAGALVATGIVLLATAPSGAPSTSSANTSGWPFLMTF